MSEIRNEREYLSQFYSGSDNLSYSPRCPYNIAGMDIQTAIDEIIRDRAKHGAQLDRAEELLTSVSGALEDFVAEKNRRFSSIDKTKEFFGVGQEKEAEDFWKRISDLDAQAAKDIKNRSRDIAVMIRDTRRRFSRKNLCIAVVGNSGEGKSTLIQKITGLNDATIPSTGGGICTAARSKIVNKPEFRARIEFYRKDEFIHEVLAPYFVHFGVLRSSDDLTDIYHAQDLLGKIVLNEASSQVKREYYARLVEYCEEWSEYRDCLGRATMELENEEQVREYVAQRAQDGTRLSSRKYRAVKNVEIECPFPTTNVRSLILIDTIGVNEPTLNVKDQMFKTIREEADFVLFVKRSLTARTAWLDSDELRLYYDILDRLPGIPANRWIYMVLNRTNTNSNEEARDAFNGNCERMLENLKKLPVSYAPGAFIDVDCTDEKDVADSLIKPMLCHLAANLKTIDELLIGRINEAIGKLIPPMDKLAQAAKGLELFEMDAQNLELTLYGPALADMVSRLMVSVEDICLELRSSGQENDLLMRAQNVIKDCDSNIPSLDEINQIYRDRNSALRTIEEVYSLTRSNLCRMFDGPDFKFDEMVIKVKKRFTAAFMEAGRFNMIPELNQDMDDPNVLNNLINALFDNTMVMAELKSEFLRFDGLTINPGDTLTHWMTELTDCLDPNNGDGNIPSYWKGLGLDKAIVEKLRTNISIIRDEFSERIRRLDSPENSICSVLNQFVTRITQLNGNIYTAWTVVLHKYIQRMYPEKFESIRTYNMRVKNWNDSIKTLQQIGNIQVIDF